MKSTVSFSPCPQGTLKQILHSINLHLFAHSCCQWLLSREAAMCSKRSVGFVVDPWVKPSFTG